ncbi:MAG: SWIM zinc finger family protein, partial [Actinomycetota bacterium]
MTGATLPADADVSALKPLAGAAAYERGLQYARQGAVLRSMWDEPSGALHATVRGNRGVYHTAAHFHRDVGRLTFSHGLCTCPMGLDCKHVVAAVAVATGDAGQRGSAGPAVSWEQSMGELLEAAPRPAGGPPRPEATPLALQLTLTPTGQGAPRLQATVVRPGKTGWVSGGLSWDRLDQSFYVRDCDQAHVRLLRELRAVRRSRPGRYGYVEQKALDLSSFDSSYLWTLLDRAAEVGVRLVHGTKALGDVAPYEHAELCLDVTRDETGRLSVAAVIRREDGSSAVPLSFIGSHGV